MVHFWKPWKHAFWLSPECQEPFSMLSRHALSSIYGLECWRWAVVGTDSWKWKKTRICAQLSIYKSDSTKWLEILTSSPQEELERAGMPQNVKISFAIHTFRSKRMFLVMSLPKGGPKPDLHPRPSQKCPQNYCKHPWQVDGTREELLEIHFLQGFPPISTLPTWAPPATNWVAVQECLDISI